MSEDYDDQGRHEAPPGGWPVPEEPARKEECVVCGQQAEMWERDSGEWIAADNPVPVWDRWVGRMEGRELDGAAVVAAVEGGAGTDVVAGVGVGVGVGVTGSSECFVCSRECHSQLLYRRLSAHDRWRMRMVLDACLAIQEYGAWAAEMVEQWPSCNRVLAVGGLAVEDVGNMLAASARFIRAVSDGDGCPQWTGMGMAADRAEAAIERAAAKLRAIADHVEAGGHGQPSQFMTDGYAARIRAAVAGMEAEFHGDDGEQQERKSK